MDMSKGMHMDRENEPAPGLETECLDTLSSQDEREIRALRFSALDTSRDGNVQVLHQEMDNFVDTFRHVGSRDEIVVAREGGRIVGFLALKKTLTAGEVGEILLAGTHDQGTVLAALIHDAEERARHAGCQRIVIVTENAAEDLPTICRLSRFHPSNMKEEEGGTRFEKTLTSFH